MQLLENLTLPNSLPLQVYGLENGLRVYFVKNPSAPVFTFQAWVNVGSRQEKLDPKLKRTGLAHLFEHMMFRGTEKFPDGKFDSLLTQYGAHDFNATTWFDRTNYYESLPKEFFSDLMALESDRFLNLNVEKELFETEKGAVLSEFRMCQDDPSTVMFDNLYGAAFEEHPYGYTTIGTEQEIKGFTVEEAQYFFKRYYAANNIVLFILGDLSEKQLNEECERTFAQLKKYDGDFQLESPIEQLRKTEKRVSMNHHQLLGSKLMMAYPMPSALNSEFGKAEVLESILTSGRSSLLRNAWLETNLASSVDGDLDQFRDPGLLGLYADIDSGHSFDELISAWDHTVSQLKSLPTTKAQSLLEKAKQQLVLGYYLCWEDNNSLGSQMGEYLFTTEDVLTGFKRVDEIKNITWDGLQEFIHETLDSSRRVILEASEGKNK